MPEPWPCRRDGLGRRSRTWPIRSARIMAKTMRCDSTPQAGPARSRSAPTKPLTTQRDLSLAYSPGVASPCLQIAKDPATAYDYTAKGNIVAVISNGTAVLGLGDLGALAVKPVMEGKAVLFKRFADIDRIDLEVDTRDVDEFVNCVRFSGPTFGGINLEDIKAPECFIIEQRLRELMDIPVFHDDQHGTAIIAAAGLINALRPDRPRPEDRQAGGERRRRRRRSPASSCSRRWACRPDNVILCDTKGVIYQGRTEGMNQWKSAHAVKTDARTLAEAMEGADVVLRPVGQGRRDPGDGEVDGAAADHLRHGQSRSGDHARGGEGRPPRRASSPPAARTIRTRSTTSWASPTSSAARSTSAPVDHQRRDEDRRRRGAGRAGARGRAGRGRRRLFRPASALWPRIHHPGRRSTRG